MSDYQDFELIGSYFTAGEDTPMYAATRKREGTSMGRWVVFPKPFDTLKKGKTFPMQIKNVFEVDGNHYLLTSPAYNKAMGSDVATVFVYKPGVTVATVSKDLVHGQGSSYYVKPEEGFFSKLGGKVEQYLLIGGILFAAAKILPAYFQSRHK